MKKSLLFIAICATLFVANPFVSLASASSVYDNAYTISDDTNLRNQSCGAGGLNDYEATREDIIDAVKASSTYGAQISSAIDSGRVGVSNFTRHHINGSVVSNSIQVFWTPDSSMYLEWINAFYGAPYRAVYAHGATSTLTSVFVSATNDIFGNCRLSVSSTGFSNLAVVSDAETDGGVRSNYIETNYPNHPDGYNGRLVGYHIQGNVTCANSNNVISAVHINAETGPDKNAIINDDGNGGKNYDHYLTEEEPYYIAVVCDGDTFYGPTVESNFGYNYHWVCTHTTPGQNPNLNICAAS